MAIPELEKYIGDVYGWEDVDPGKLRLSPENTFIINKGMGMANVKFLKLYEYLDWDDKKTAYCFKKDLKVFLRKAAEFSITKEDYYLYEALIPQKELCIRFFYEGPLGNLKKLPLELDGTNTPIYSLFNRTDLKVPLYEDIKTSIPLLIKYIKFFFYNVKGRHGRFHIVEDVSEIPNALSFIAKDKEISQWKMTSVNQKNKDFKIKYIGQKKEIVEFSAYMIFKDSLFRADVSINLKDGNISLSNEELISEFSKTQ